ncbi:PREDICTED: nuclear transcription factor Y subunit B-1-like isoform X2 [Nelumbo nucifera]|uniref:Nuclear transcription factor Y subunit B-1-like isoform X1 n=2 Tax=Nelumbo nucifera TaxID=4432 RepID=A0A1U7Z9X6_NELNU|nr:PREDICTED: nuclear transcription factor Y subunit B-1-like isoform X1 [Nelumbo nucifera]XP_010243941.1 PREDICTED: nuclear transcription factor Y subunit B-1-like isoform X2 [Nelumbo nucifera]DAD20213.1 TPA_asm: hypothetical protein HUJ06_021676 [Nelumbo nucifera]
MERAGFHGYQRHPKSGSGMKMMVAANINHSSSNSQSTVVDDMSERDSGCTVREQDRFMPIANVIRIMRKVLPAHAKISDDAKETIQECVSEYISFITGEANDRCQREQRKTITADDVLWAMSKLGFDDYIEPLTVYLQRYREFEGERGSIRGGDPLVKRTADLGGHALGIAAFTPAFHMGVGVGHQHQHGHGVFGAAINGGYRAMTNNNSSQPAPTINDHRISSDSYQPTYKHV